MLQPLIVDPFRTGTLPEQLSWHQEPARWSLHSEGVLRIEPDAATDFWQTTHYGFQVDNGHFLHTAVNGDFVLTVHVRFRPVHQYDQAGLMVRVGPTCWLKASVEYEPEGPGRLGAVVTNFGYSDWSTQPFPSGPGAVWLRARREADDYIVDSSADGRDWMQLRMAHLHEGRGLPVKAGLYACSPKGTGYVADFSTFSIERGRLVVPHP
jgi:regulation of enolase protein 1 (concanavalin A-like superfamily)